MTLKVNRRSKAAREALDDLDYTHKLDSESAEWLQTFMRATVANSMDDMATLVGGDRDKLAQLQSKVFAEDRAKRRDLMYMGTRVAEELDIDEAGALVTVHSDQFDTLKCGVCFREPCECDGDRQRLNRYGAADYLPAERTEDMQLSELELAQRMQAYSLQPYGDSPKGLEQGHTVKICLPYHLLDKAWGYVLDYRPMTGEYLVRSMSRKGLRDKDGTSPVATVLWVKPNALRRFRLATVKGFGKRADKNSSSAGETK